jgi:hypothetical protein
MSKEADFIDELRRASRQTAADALHLFHVMRRAGDEAMEKASKRSRSAADEADGDGRDFLFRLARFFLDGYNDSLRIHARFFEQVTEGLREIGRSHDRSACARGRLTLSGPLGGVAKAGFKLANEFADPIDPVFSFSELETVADGERFGAHVTVAPADDEPRTIEPGKRRAFEVTIALEETRFRAGDEYLGRIYAHLDHTIVAEVEVELRVFVGEPR